MPEPTNYLPSERNQLRNSNRRKFGTSQIGGQKIYFDAPEPMPQAHLETQSEHQPWVLHIDDDIDLVEAMTARLSSSGFRVVAAHDGSTGYQSALMCPADAIILDFDMPGGRGDQVIKALKNNSRTSQIPILVLTAIGKKSLERKLLSMGADIFMTKPFDFNLLRSNLRNLIDFGSAGATV